MASMTTTTTTPRPKGDRKESPTTPAGQVPGNVFPWAPLGTLTNCLHLTLEPWATPSGYSVYCAALFGQACVVVIPQSHASTQDAAVYQGQEDDAGLGGHSSAQWSTGMVAVAVCCARDSSPKAPQAGWKPHLV